MWAATSFTSVCGPTRECHHSNAPTCVVSIWPPSADRPQLVVADVSFISLRLIAADICSLATADIVVLVKPQFEAGRVEADRGRGVIRDPDVWRQALLGAWGAIVGAGAAIMGGMVSPVTGAEGNVEFLLHADARDRARGLSDPDAAVDRAVADAVRVKGA